MSLDWNAKDIKDNDELFRDDGNPDGLLETMIWFTLIIDIGDWSADNIEEVRWRIQFYEIGFGPLRGAGICVDKDEVNKVMGLRTNVGHKPRRTWMARMRRQYRHPHTSGSSRSAREARDWVNTTKKQMRK